MKKIKAFTLLELLIGMVLSSIIIAFGMQLFLLTQKQFTAFRNAKDTTMKTSTLSFLLEQDTFDSARITYTGEELEFEKSNGKVHYIIGAKEIIRQTEELTDTFSLTHDEIQVQFVGETNLVGKLNFHVYQNEEMRYVSIDKMYDAQTLMKIQSK